ncbi:Response regulator containing a CheY-like receiver domain and an HTH DNA-binding domain [Curtobacterium sp. 314Chir4.1]|uniref:helix-turn-helix transcriptional regulator n=1 Tax=Curtobacterium TaxID=2034 RepID=UPI000BC72E25|nr:LuxR C-terminal-related transcriptional regulator [Curtobacterium sp. 314Chir4.1]SOC87082.1 Response regulator containing a CheY-like receiver domain and an HTH DNA-binding domain [Curtobacterium sp. 314Chir4.1]
MVDPAPLAEPATRALVVQHARLVAERADQHALTLESLLAVLRSTRVDDRAARVEAAEIASAALVDLRTSNDEERNALVEPVSRAFLRLRNDLRPLVRFGSIDIQFVEPPATGRALPGEVAHAARAIVRTAVLAHVDRGTAERVRVQWDCDGRNLLVEIRDDGDGSLDVHDDTVRPIAERVSALDGDFRVESTDGWGSTISIVMPLDPPALGDRIEDAEALTPRERDVLRLVVAGAPNADVAAQLGITVNTAKYHVANLLRKYGARSRAELSALAR